MIKGINQSQFYNVCINRSIKYLFRYLNDSNFVPENYNQTCHDNKTNIFNKNKNLSLTAQNFINKSENKSIDTFLTESLQFKEIADLLNTKIVIPNINIETSQYNEIQKSIKDSTNSFVELPRTGKTTYELFGKPDSRQPISNIPCPGCGSNLHCNNTGIAGYLPSEKYLQLTPLQLKTTLCQRCLLLKEKNIALDVNVDKNDYRRIIKEIKKHPSLLIVLVDVFDMQNSFFYRIRELIHRDRPIYIIGNKVDLLPSDGIGYLNSIKNALIKLCTDNKFCMKNHIKHVGLISAKTGYGVENLITKLLKEWKLRGHVYILGCANSGKSTFFNALISSDYCRSSAREILLRATTSIWPGTTLNLLKFPILNPKPAYMIQRYNRFKEMSKLNEEERLSAERYSTSNNPSLIQHIGLSISTPSERAITNSVGSDSPFVVPSYTVTSSGNMLQQHTGPEGALKYLGAKPFPYDDTKFKYWCFDTPGLINQNQIINILNQEELAKVLPSRPITPRSFVVKPGQVVFLTGLSRIDYLQGDVSIYMTIFSSEELAIHIINSHEADDFWKNNLGSTVLSVPIGNKERISSLPSLIGKEMKLEGIGWKESAADIVLSSLGWAAITVGLGRNIVLRAYTIGGKGCRIRTPSLLPHAINLKGKRIKGTPSYELSGTII